MRALVLSLCMLSCGAAFAKIVYAPVVAGKPLEFPADYGSHADFRTEWWYVTGWLHTEGGESLGFQITFFRTKPDADPANPSAFAPRPILDRAMAQACLAGLWLRFDFLDQSHRISQEIDNPSGSFWHGIMHRREPDYGNAKYWFRRVGRHPSFAALCDSAKEIAQAAPPDAAAEFLRQQNNWDPFAFVDLVATASDRHSPLEKLCRQIQLTEWQLLFGFCFRSAIGGVEK